MARIDRRTSFFSYMGYAGFTTVVASAVVYGMIPAVQAYLQIGLLFGSLCLVISLAGNFKKIKDHFGKRSARHGANAFILILLVLGILVFVEAICAKHNARFDLTSDKKFTLSDQSVKILKNFDKTIRVTAFFPEGQTEAEKAKDLLEQYAYISPKFSFEFVDPDRSPGKARRYKITTYGTLVLETGTREERITQTDEQDLTNAMLRVMREGKKTVYFLTGHDEKSLDNHEEKGYSAAREAIEGQNYAVEDLLLMRADEVPEDASVLIIAGPEKPLFPEELSALEYFVEQGGHLFILIDPETESGLATFLSSFGIEVGQNIIVDKLSRIFGADYLTPIVSQYAGYHDITENFETASFFPLARSVGVAEGIPSHVENIELAKTGTSSWAETDMAMLKNGEVSFDKGKDIMGPITVAVVSTINQDKGGEEESNSDILNGDEAGDDSADEEKRKPARIVVFGDSDFASNAYLNLSGNRDLFLNSLSWLAEEEELISIRPRKQENQPVVLSYTEGRVIFWTSVILLPSSVMLLGVMVLRRRRLKLI